MNYIGNKTLCHLLEYDDTYDFVAFVITPWHTHSLLAALKYVENKEKKKLKGIIVIKPHEENRWLLNNDIFSECINSVSIYRYSDDETILNKIQSEIEGLFYFFRLTRMKDDKCDNFYFFKPNGFRYSILSSLYKCNKRKKNLIAVSIDEGVGVYTTFREETFWRSLQNAIFLSKSFKNKFLSVLKAVETHIFSREKLIESRYYLDCNLMKINENGICYPNGKMPYYFREVNECSARVNNCFLKIERDYILVNTQPIDAFFSSGEDIQYEIIRNCIPIFYKAGFDVIIKPHPREINIEKYKKLGVLVVEDNGISQESLLCRMRKPKFIVSCFSTTLISTHLCWDIIAISLARMFIKTNDVTKYFEDILCKFEKAFQNMVYFPDDNDKLLEILIKEKDNSFGEV